VKTNIGHSKRPRIAGLIKVSLSIAPRETAAEPLVRRTNRTLHSYSLPLKVVTELTPWGAPGQRRIGGVSSFGLGGTNAHLF